MNRMAGDRVDIAHLLNLAWTSDAQVLVRNLYSAKKFCLLWLLNCTGARVHCPRKDSGDRPWEWMVLFCMQSMQQEIGFFQRFVSLSHLL